MRVRLREQRERAVPVDHEPTTTVRREDVGTVVEESAPPAGPFTGVPLFANLDTESLRELEQAARPRGFRAGEIIFHRDDPGQMLYVIKQGKVRIYITSPDGQEVTLAVFGPGDYFGELAILDGRPRSASAIALDVVETQALQRSDFIAAVNRHPRIAIQVMQALSVRLRHTDAMIEDLLFLDVHGRVAKKLLDLAELHGVRTPEGIRIEMKLTQTDLAALVGASRESVNKVIGYFVDKRFISSEKRKITILRLADLRQRVC
jgi:CRP/FNR family transcriptional regulator/CRP/FNR family cyclic AMP-dependent transcriptional regulator